jgi:hypothetical protein
MTRKTAYKRTTPRRRKSKTSKSLLVNVGLAALSRVKLPLWAKIALGIAALGTAGYTSGLTDKMGIDGRIRGRMQP